MYIIYNIRKFAPKITHFISHQPPPLPPKIKLKKLWLKTIFSASLADSFDLNCVKPYPGNGPQCWKAINFVLIITRGSTRIFF